MDCIIKEYQVSDFYQIHKMYDSLSDESKHYFHPKIFGFKSVNLLWYLNQLALFFSSIKVIKKGLLRLYPRSNYFLVLAVNEKELLGMAYLKIKRPYSNGFLASLGMVVIDRLHGRGIGSKLLNNLIYISKKWNIKKITLDVIEDNFGAIKLYKKFGFKEIEIIKDGDFWEGRRYNCIRMNLIIP
jgi:RimJ/RimL family protein N-acetyltransferase